MQLLTKYVLLRLHVFFEEIFRFNIFLVILNKLAYFLAIVLAIHTFSWVNRFWRNPGSCKKKSFCRCDPWVAISYKFALVSLKKEDGVAPLFEEPFQCSSTTQSGKIDVTF